MSETLKKYFIPHEGNNYKPHALHTKRAVFYSGVFLAMKAIVFVFALLLPTEAFLIPDVLNAQAAAIVKLTNSVRLQKGLPAIVVVKPLMNSSDAKAKDMAINNYFSHTSPQNRSLAYFLNQAGYPYKVAGENLAMGFSDAESVVNAWIKSPTHYSNLTDKDFSQIGVGVEAGYYNGQPTVFVAQHFGTPRTGADVAPFTGFDTTTTTTVPAAVQRVRGIKIARADEDPEPESFIFDRELSKVYWTEENGVTKLEVRAFISGDIKSAVVSVQNYPIELYKTPSGTYVGSITISGPADSFFNPIITPSITITGVKGALQDTIDWANVKIVAQNPVQRYLQVKKALSPFMSIFSVSNTIYWGFLIVCVTAFILNVVIEIRKQHYHIIFQTLFIMVLLVWLLRF